MEKPQTKIAYNLLYGDLQNKDSEQDKRRNKVSKEKDKIQNKKSKQDGILQEEESSDTSTDSEQNEILQDEESSDSSTDDDQSGNIDKCKRKKKKTNDISYDKFVKSINDLINFEKATDPKYTELYKKFGDAFHKRLDNYVKYIEETHDKSTNTENETSNNEDNNSTQSSETSSTATSNSSTDNKQNNDSQQDRQQNDDSEQNGKKTFFDSIKDRIKNIQDIKIEFKNDKVVVLQDNFELIKLIGKGMIKCKLPNKHSKCYKSQVEVLQNHGCTGTCNKGKGKADKCRFGFPRPPSRKTIIATPLTGGDEKENAKKLSRYCHIMCVAQELLKKLKKEEKTNISFKEFLLELSKLIKPKEGKKTYTVKECKKEYYAALATSSRGQILILKREVQDMCINNYESEFLHAWDANLDIQLAFDPFSVITYMISYIGKDETGVTNFMKETLQLARHLAFKDQLRALVNCYIKNRQIGASECIYRMTSGLHMKDSNITCIWVATGFPEHRQSFYRKVMDKNDKPIPIARYDEEEEDVSDTVDDSTSPFITIKGKNGKFCKSISPDERYVLRPPCIEKICLAQFATHYTYAKTVSKNIWFDVAGAGSCKKGKEINKNKEEYHHNAEGDDEIIAEHEMTESIDYSEYHIYSDKNILLPKCIELTGDAGYMRIRSKPAVLRTINNKRREGHEAQYAELQLYWPWKNENDIPRDMDNCLALYEVNKEEVMKNKYGLFPFSSCIDLKDFDTEAGPPAHIYDELDPEFQQEMNEDENKDDEVDPEYAGRHHDHFDANVGKNNIEDFRFKAIDIPPNNEMKELLKKLVPEQMRGLDKVVKYCTDIVKSSNKGNNEFEPLRLIIHGGSGFFFHWFFWKKMLYMFFCFFRYWENYGY